MKPGSSITLVSTCESAAGVAQTGVGASYTFAGYLNGVLQTLSVTTTEIGSGRYYHTFTLPSSKGVFALFGANGSNVVWPAEWEFVVENNDLDSIYAIAAKPVVNATATGAPAVATPLIMIPYRWQNVSITIVDQTGNPVNLSGYINPLFTVRDKTHSSINYSLATGFTLGANGVAAWTIPETASFYSAIDAQITAGTDPLTLYWDLVADNVSDGQSQTLAYGTITLQRYEGSE